MSKNRKMPPAAQLRKEIADGATTDFLREKYGMSNNATVYRYLRNHKIPMPADYRPPPSLMEGQVRRGPVEDERRVIINGVSLPRLRFLHGEYEG